LPTAWTLLWHELHVPSTLMWLKRATGRHANGVWHWEQSSDDRMWFVGFAVDPVRAPAVWHAWQAVGVPFSAPSTWHCEHSTLACAPMSSKPVVK
jgi:hypothetical protein